MRNDLPVTGLVDFISSSKVLVYCDISYGNYGYSHPYSQPGGGRPRDRPAGGRAVGVAVVGGAVAVIPGHVRRAAHRLEA